MRKERLKRIFRWVRVGSGILLSLLLLDYYAYPYGFSPGGASGNRGENGLWLRYTWYFGQHNDAEIKTLALNLRARQIRYAYFHVRGITQQGTLKYRYAEKAQHLIALLHQAAPEIKILAWVYAGNQRGEGEVELNRPEVRRQMTGEARWLTETCGFDGVQWDYEICDDGDPDFLHLLRETRAVLPKSKLLGAAIPLWMPGLLQKWGWSDNYMAQTAGLCDQIAVMCYDSGFVLPRSYVWLVHQQVVHATQAAAKTNPACRVLFGIPTYGDGFRSHNPRAENIRFALRGVREGLSDPRTRRETFAGVAPFADYTMDAKDGNIFTEFWLKP